MADTSFLVGPGQRARLASRHQRLPDGSLRAVESPVAEPRTSYSGTGLYATGPDYLRFLRMLLAGGQLDGARLLHPETVAEMARNQIGELTVGVLREEHHAALREVFGAVCEAFGARLVETGGEDDHVHLVVAYPPPVSVSGLVNSLKGVSSRLLRKRYGAALKTHRRHLWSPSYFAASAGGAPLTLLKLYVEAQRVAEAATG
jgi:putative transposase